MTELKRRVLFTVLMAPITALISLVVQKTLSAWGIFDPLTQEMGSWLKTHAAIRLDSEAILWGITLAFSLALYGIALYFIWRTNRPLIPILAASPAIPQIQEPAEPQTDTKPGHDVWLQDAACYALHGRWLADDEQGFEAEHLSLADKIAQQMRELAGRSKYTIWGKTEPTALHVPIPPDFWVDNQIDNLRLLGDTAENVRTERATHGHTFPHYHALRVNRAETEKIWPPPRDMTLIELCGIGCERLNIPTNAHMLLFGYALRQAGADGSIAFTGYHLPNGLTGGRLSGQAIRTGVRVGIPRDKFKSLSFDLWPILVTHNNRQTRLYDMSLRSHECYVDIHANHEQAEAWLKTDAQRIYRAKAAPPH